MAAGGLLALRANSFAVMGQKTKGFCWNQWQRSSFYFLHHWSVTNHHRRQLVSLIVLICTDEMNKRSDYRREGNVEELVVGFY